MSSFPGSITNSPEIIKSLTPQQRLVWHIISRYPADDYTPTECLALAWGDNATTINGWQNPIHALIYRMNKRLAPHSLRLVSRNGEHGGGYRIVCLDGGTV